MWGASGGAFVRSAHVDWDLGACLGVLLGSVATIYPSLSYSVQYTWNPHFPRGTRSPPVTHYDCPLRRSAAKSRHSVWLILETRHVSDSVSWCHWPDSLTDRLTE
jgi:hypothetical protein